MSDDGEKKSLSALGEALEDAVQSEAAARAKAAEASKTDSTAVKVDEPVAPAEAEKKPMQDELGRTYATGKRKESCARVWLKPGVGGFTVNGRKLDRYFGRSYLQMLAVHPFQVSDRLDGYEVMAFAKGGGLSGQAGAVRHGVAKALALREPGLRPVLKKAGLLTRDPRTVERKKYGHRKARRSFQFSKR